MSEEREARIGRNEALYRQVNERIEEVNEAFGALTGDFTVVCECGELSCMQQIRVPCETYERTRANPSRFITLPGHQEPDVEDVVERQHGYQIVEKATPGARRMAEKMDPRS